MPDGWDRIAGRPDRDRGRVGPDVNRNVDGFSRWNRGGVMPATLEPVTLAIHLQDIHISTWWVRRSSNAPVSRSESNTAVHSSKGRLVVTRMEPHS